MKSLRGKAICFTGTLSVPRAEFARLLEGAGASVVSTLSRSTDLLIVGANPSEAKLDKARENGTMIWDEHAARRALNGEMEGGFIVKVYGQSDDLVEVHGSGTMDELQGGDEDTFVRFSNGTYIAIHYGDEGIWRARVIDSGQGKIKKLYGLPDDGDADQQAHRDPDAPVYSDVVIIESHEPILLESWGRKPLPAPRVGLAKANEIIKEIYTHSSDWWDDMDQDTRNAVLETVAEIVEGKK